MDSSWYISGVLDPIENRPKRGDSSLKIQLTMFDNLPVAQLCQKLKIAESTFAIHFTASFSSLSLLLPVREIFSRFGTAIYIIPYLMSYIVTRMRPIVENFGNR